MAEKLFRNLLVPTDGSEASSAATALAVQLAATYGASLTFVNVVEVDKIVASIVPGQGFTDPTPAISSLRAAGVDMLKDAIATAAASGIKAASALLEGDTIESILQAAKTHGTDLIVMGSHGRSGLQRLVLGSVAEGVLRHAAVPVLVTKARTS